MHATSGQELLKTGSRFYKLFVDQPVHVQGPTECKIEYQTTCSTSQVEHQVEEDVPHCVVEEEEKCEGAGGGYLTDERCLTWPVTRCKLVKKVVTKYRPNTKVTCF